MENKRFLTAQDVMEMLGVSLSYSYKLIRRFAKGFITFIYKLYVVIEMRLHLLYA